MKSAKIDIAYDLLVRDIMNGVHAPGAALRLAALAERYQLSATPLREALSRLGEKHLVVATPNRGWRVTPVSPEEFEDIQIARLVVESGLLEDAIAHGGLDWESGIVAAHYRLTQSTPPLTRHDDLATRQNWLQAHDEFHKALLAAARSNWLKSLYEQTTMQLQRHRQGFLFHIGSVDVANPEQPSVRLEELLRETLSLPRHTQLMQVVLDRDRDGALATLREHIESTQAIFRSTIEQLTAKSETKVRTRKA